MSSSLFNMSLESLPLSYTKTFFTFTRLIKWIGLDIFGGSLDWKNINSSVKMAGFTIMFIPFVFLQLILVFKIKPDEFLEHAAVIPMDLMFCLAIIMMIVILSRRDEIRDIFMEIGDLWPKKLEEDETRNLIRSWLRRIDVLVKSFYTYSVINVTGFVLVPLAATGFSHLVVGADVYTLPFHTAWEVNSIPMYLLTYLWETSASVSCTLCLYVPFILLIVIITFNISLLLRLLHIDLKNAVKLVVSSHGIRDIRNCGPSMSNRRLIKVSYESRFAEIKRVVIIHQRMMRLVAKLNNVSGLVLLILVTIASVFISFFGFLTVIFGGAIEITVSALTVLNAIIVIFLLALSGQLLCDTSSGVADAAYHSLWYESDRKVRKIVLLIIVRSQQPCYLSALGFSNLTLHSFTEIMSSAWTYFTLLVQLYGDV